MNAKMYLAGIVGGILCTLALWFPLTEYLPSVLLANWRSVDATLAWSHLVLACLMVLASGVVAARLSGTTSRAGAAVSGAVCGLLASMTGYAFVGGAAAGVWGARPIWKHGLKPAADDAQFIQLLMDSISGIHWWTTIALWGAILFGLGLGALGGLLAGPAGKPDPDIFLIYQITAVAAMLMNGLSLVVITSTSSLLVKSIAETAAKEGVLPAYSADSILAYPVITTFAIMFVSLLVWQVFYRRGRDAGQVMGIQARLSAAVLLFTPVIVAILTYVLLPSDTFFKLYLPFFVVLIPVGAWILRRAWGDTASAWNFDIPFPVMLRSVVLCAFIIYFGGYFGVLPASLGDVLLVITSITALLPEGSQASVATDAAELVRTHYVTYFQSGLLSFLVAVVFTVVISGVVLFAVKFFSRRR